MIVVPGERPPNFEQILRAFPGAGGPGVIFAYGDEIYNPSFGVIPPMILAHEAVHGRRQGLHTPGWWWDQYIADPEFRYNEELVAHVAEYQTQVHLTDRNQRARLLMVTANRLVAPLYNYQPPRSLGQAMRDLRREIES